VQLRDWFFGLFGRCARTEEVKGDTARGITHVIILDGTASSLEAGDETNAGLLFKLLREQGWRENLMVHYEAGVQWRDWRSTWEVVTGRGIDRLIRRAYGVLAGRWKPGDRIVLVGYSRGAFAVRSLAGMIGRVGLLKSHHTTVSHIRTAYRHYEAGGESMSARAFHAEYCHDTCRIEAVAVWDTVKALGVRLPLIWRLSEGKTEFHDARLDAHVNHGFHALALDERRAAYTPVLWQCPPDWAGHLEQVWFRGTHGDVGGHLDGFPAARPLANIPLVWMLDRLEACGVSLPEGWADRFPQDATAPSVGQWRGWAKIFWVRRRRTVGRDPSERLHESVRAAS